MTWTPVFYNHKWTAYLVDDHGHLLILSNHDIEEDGTVTPSVGCAGHDDCQFHEFIRLVGWKKGLSPVGVSPPGPGEPTDAPKQRSEATVR